MEYKTVKEVSDKLRVHQNTVLHWLNNGTLKGVKFGHLWRIPDTEIDKVEEAKK